MHVLIPLVLCSNLLMELLRTVAEALLSIAWWFLQRNGVLRSEAESNCYALYRWNMIKADDVGLTLQLLPMLLGFFTYKGAMIARGGVNFFTDISDKRVLVEPLPESAAKQ